jgi:hypothetical protein
MFGVRDTPWDGEGTLPNEASPSASIDTGRVPWREMISSR